jgi:hypothetical protein
VQRDQRRFTVLDRPTHHTELTAFIDQHGPTHPGRPSANTALPPYNALADEPPGYPRSRLSTTQARTGAPMTLTYLSAIGAVKGDCVGSTR